VLRAEQGAWRIQSASAELPGASTMTASGAVAFGEAGPGFAGPVTFASEDFQSFRRWLSGGEDVGSRLGEKITLKGDVSARLGAVQIQNADLSVDGARSSGRLAWTSGEDGGRPRLDAQLVSDRLDLDALGMGRIAGGALAGGPLDLSLSLNAKTLVFGGVAMTGVAVEGLVGADGIELTRLAVADAEGAALSG
ncbi:hypothetical protein ACIKT0_19735, partial [Hansschlegelia beijingensis]|uniref:hypothetical protein n=1 Tax=Hansschlegelia beijingensis TaxID=1133344 RepID=UPI00387F02D8